MTAVNSLSPLIVDGVRRDLLAASAGRTPQRRLPFGVVRGVRLVLRRTPRPAA
jgi:hypothetical protein